MKPKSEDDGREVMENVTLVPEVYWKLNEIVEATGFDKFDDNGLMTMTLSD
jgi:hypothetical protein